MKEPQNQGYKKIFYIIAGTISLTVALIGLILPIVPSIPLTLFSAWCYYQGSDKLYTWLINHAILGPLITDYNKNGMSKERKRKIIALTWTPFLLITTLLPEYYLLQTGTLLTTIIGTIIIIKSKTKKQVKIKLSSR